MVTELQFDPSNMKKLAMMIVLLLLLVTPAYSQATDTLPWPDKDILPELKNFISERLWQDYDITSITLTQVEHASYEDVDNDLAASGGRLELYKITAHFYAKHNENHSILRDKDGKVKGQLNENLYKNNREECKSGSAPKWLYLLCGVTEGYIFEGNMEAFVARTNKGWAVLCNHCTRKSSYALDGYLILGERKKEGYVWFPEEK